MTETNEGNRAQLPQLGKEMRQHFLLEESYTSLNHGSFGTYPRVVRDSLRAWQDKAELNPDFWMRCVYQKELAKVREQLAAFVSCNADELVFVQNTSFGINSVIRSLSYKDGDKMIYLSTVYGAVNQTMQYVSDSNSNIKLIRVDVTYPISDDDLVTAIENTILAEEAIEDGLAGGRIRFGVFDAISSLPCVRIPFDRIIKLLREHNILSIIDGAHAIGQIPLNLHMSNPDFFITNCHKWLYSVRGSAILYVPRRHQAQIHSTVISHGYAQKNFQEEFEWVGTQDFSSYLTISKALEFRAWCGGEERIQKYCNDLALKGGRHAASILGTNEIIECSLGDTKLTTHMVNVRLPLTVIADDKFSAQVKYFYDTLFAEFNCFACPFLHGGKWWARMSAQIYTDLDDFDKVAHAFKSICERLEHWGGNPPSN